MKKVGTLVSLLGLLALVTLPLQAEGKRFALVIGNADYGALGQLKNPVNDASDMGKALQALGFQTEVLTNADLSAMENAVVKLSGLLSADKTSTGLFFYAGHGVQSAGVNYLLPMKADIPAEAFLKTKALSAQSVLDLLQAAGNGLNLIILDACRDNPFSWSRSLSRGLSVVGSQPTGSIMAYATSAGSTAQDGTGRNGVFTGELLKNLATPGIDIKQVFDRTGAAVMKATSNKQVPAIYSQYFETFYLAAPPAPPATAVATPVVSPAVAVMTDRPPAATGDVKSIWNWLSYSRTGQGLKFFPLSGEDTGEEVTIGGRPAWLVKGSAISSTYPAILYFNVEDPQFQNGSAPSVSVTVEYFDDRGSSVSNSWIKLEYSSSGNHLKGSMVAAFEDAGSDLLVGTTKTWKSYTWKLDDAKFNRASNGHDLRLVVAPTLKANLGSITIARPVAPTPTATLTGPWAALDGDWYFQGTGKGLGTGTGDHRDSRLRVNASEKTMIFYHFEDPATVKTWVEDFPGDTQRIDTLNASTITTTVTNVVPLPWGTSQLGTKSKMIYRIKGDELNIWWDWGQALSNPYNWIDYVTFKRTRP